MKVMDASFTIELTKQEARNLAYCVYYNLKNSIENHWNKLQQNKDGEPLFYKNEAEKLEVMNLLFNICGESNLAEGFEREFAGMFANRRKEREPDIPDISRQEITTNAKALKELGEQ